MTSWFHDLPGVDQLDGKSWGGMTSEDLVVGSFATWRMRDGNGSSGSFIRVLAPTASPQANSSSKSYYRVVR